MRLERRKFFLNQSIINVSTTKYKDYKLSQNIDRKGYKNYLNLFVKCCNRKICNNSFWKDLYLCIN